MSSINYSQCWEDVNLLKSALNIKSDDVVVSITSGGDNSLALLLSKPKKLFLVDKNPTQNYLVELKLKAPHVLNHKQYLELLGVHDSKFRTKYFEQVSNLLSSDTSSWFVQNMELIESGVIHGGKFERYLNKFRKYLLPLVHSRKTVLEFINQSNLEDQITFYENTWNTWRWRAFFNLASNASLLKTFARQTGAIEVQETKNTSYFRRLEDLIYRSHLRSNNYMCYSLIGEYGESLPDYLQQNNYGTLQNSTREAYEFHYEDLLSFLRRAPNNSFTKFNLSDSFEFSTLEDTIVVWKEIIRTARKDAVVAYWCNQLEHLPPQELRQNLVCNSDLEIELKEQDRLYFYRSFHVYKITK